MYTSWPVTSPPVSHLRHLPIIIEQGQAETFLSPGVGFPHLSESGLDLLLLILTMATSQASNLFHFLPFCSLFIMSKLCSLCTVIGRRLMCFFNCVEEGSAPSWSVCAECESCVCVHYSFILSSQDVDSLIHLAEPWYRPYQGHNAFREKYFSGINKKGGRQENKPDVNGGFT